MSQPPPRAARAAAFAAFALVACAGPAHADKPLWELGLGVGGVSVPHYRGSEQSHSWLLPVPYVVYRGDILRATREGARAVVLEGNRVEVDLSFAASPPTRSRDNRARTGMPDLEATLEFGPNLNVTLAKGEGWKFDFRLPVRTVFGLDGRPDHLGWTASPVLNLDLRAQGWNVGFQGGPLAASRGYNAHYYSVDPAYATATRPAYAAGGGSGGWQFTASLSKRYDDYWLGGFVRNDTVSGARFDNSPLVTQRSTLAFGFAISWVIKVSDRRVADDR